MDFCLHCGKKIKAGQNVIFVTMPVLVFNVHERPSYDIMDISEKEVFFHDKCFKQTAPAMFAMCNNFYRTKEKPKNIKQISQKKLYPPSQNVDRYNNEATQLSSALKGIGMKIPKQRAQQLVFHNPNRTTEDLIRLVLQQNG